MLRHRCNARLRAAQRLLIQLATQISAPVSHRYVLGWAVASTHFPATFPGLHQFIGPARRLRVP